MYQIWSFFTESVWYKHNKKTRIRITFFLLVVHSVKLLNYFVSKGLCYVWIIAKIKLCVWLDQGGVSGATKSPGKESGKQTVASPYECTLLIRNRNIYKDVIKRQTYARVIAINIFISFIVRNLEK